MPSLPREIWQHIAQFIHPDDLQGLISLNRIVFDIVMDCRYRQMTFAYIDKRMVRNLTRLKFGCLFFLRRHS
jgi:regulatory protein YycH of two-component signal transduction system YycFG